MSIVNELTKGIIEGAGGITPTGAATAIANASGKVIDFVDGIIERISPDPTKQAELKLEARRLEQTGELAQMTNDYGLLQGQIEINKIDATSSFKFVAWARPAAIWVGVSALFFSTTIPFAITTGVWLWRCVAEGTLLPTPSLDIEMVFLLLAQLLGLSGMRTYEKKHGVARED